MSTIKPLYGSNNQAYTVTLNSFTNNTYNSGAAINNTASLFDDIKFQFKWKNGAAVAGVPIVQVYLAESANGGTNYSDSLAAASVGVAPTSPVNLKLLYTLSCPTAATTYISDCFYIKTGQSIYTMPDFSFLVFLNGTGGTSDATAGNFSVWYEGLNLQNV